MQKRNWSMPIGCPVCLWNDVDSSATFIVTDVDIDELNAEGSIDFRCDICEARFSTGLIHWQIYGNEVVIDAEA